MPKTGKVPENLKGSKKSKNQSVQVDDFKRVAGAYQAIKADRKNLNSLLTLVEIFEATQNIDLLQVSSEAIFKVFQLLAIEGSYRVCRVNANMNSEESSDPKEILARWLDSIYMKYYNRSIDILKMQEFESVGFNAVMNLIRLTASGASESFTFPVEILKELIETIISKSPEQTELYGVFDEAINSYRDIRYYTLRLCGQIAKGLQDSQEDKYAQYYSGIFKIISEIVMETDVEIESGAAEVNPFFVEASLPAAVSTCKGHLVEFSSCWLTFIQGISGIEPKLHKAFLSIVQERVIPYMINPTLLADYLTDSFNAGGLVSLLALNGLFTLMHKHNLDYPSFFPKLYSILDNNILHCRYRKRFCKLFGLFMTSTHMPAYLVAAFVKRISRLSLDASPAVINWVIPFVYNMFKSHPAVRVLIHRQDSSTKSAENDPFSMDELDPAKCKALDSSIWEIHALSRHYWSGAVKQARIFTERLTKPPFKLDDYLEGPSYNSLIEEELSHRWTKVPPLNLSIPTKLF